MNTCIFCKIINGDKPAEVVYEDEKVLGFKDISPKAEIHYLLVPKTHIESIKSENSEDYVRDLVAAAKKIAWEKNLSGYKLAFNVGREGGQMVDHIHLHFLAGENAKSL